MFYVINWFRIYNGVVQFAVLFLCFFFKVVCYFYNSNLFLGIYSIIGLNTRRKNEVLFFMVYELQIQMWHEFLQVLFTIFICLGYLILVLFLFFLFIFYLFLV